MPTKDYQTDLLQRLNNSEYAAQYLKVVLDETLKDGDIDAFFLLINLFLVKNSSILIAG